MISRGQCREQTIWLVALLATGCAQQPRLTVVRLDGQPMLGNPVLTQQLDTDRLICQGEMQKANMSGVVIPTGGLVQQTAQEIQRDNAASQVMTGCLAQKGYIIVPEHEAEARAAQLRANAATPQKKLTSNQ